MGQLLSRLMERLRGVKEVRLLMLGLDNAGKTTILYKLKSSQTVTTVPTAGFNVECVVHRNVKFHVWDVGGQDKIRPLWRHYHTGTRAVIFVVDSQDDERLHEARIELHRILTARELAQAVVLVYANKQDLPHVLDVPTIKDRLQLDRFPHRVWAVVGSCATSGEGLVEGLTWLAENVRVYDTPQHASAIEGGLVSPVSHESSSLPADAKKDAPSASGSDAHGSSQSGATADVKRAAATQGAVRQRAT